MNKTLLTVTLMLAVLGGTSWAAPAAAAMAGAASGELPKGHPAIPNAVASGGPDFKIKLLTNRDFGSGYKYALIVEDALVKVERADEGTAVWIAARPTFR